MLKTLRRADPDFANNLHQPNFVSAFDPMWGVNFYHGCGGSPYAYRPYLASGSLPAFTFWGNGGLKSAQHGWAAYGTATNSTDGFGVTNTNSDLLWAPPTYGTFVVCFKPLRNPGTPRRGFFFYGDPNGAGTNASFACYLASVTGNLNVGWASGASGRIISTIAGSYASATDDYVVIHCGYTPAGQFAYVNAQLVPNSTAQTSGVYSGTDSIVGIGGDNINKGNDEPIYYVLFMEHVMTFRQIAESYINPFNWMFLPRTQVLADTFARSRARPYAKNQAVNRAGTF